MNKLDFFLYFVFKPVNFIYQPLWPTAFQEPGSERGLISNVTC